MMVVTKAFLLQLPPLHLVMLLATLLAMVLAMVLLLVLLLHQGLLLIRQEVPAKVMATSAGIARA
jgi:hypothetical protein